VTYESFKSQFPSYPNNSHKIHCNSIEFLKYFVFLLYDNSIFIQYSILLKCVPFSTIIIMRLERNEYSKRDVDTKWCRSTGIILMALLCFKTATTDKICSLAPYIFQHFCPFACQFYCPAEKVP